MGSMVHIISVGAQNSKHYKKESNKEIACEVIEPSIDT